jgi:hypothetical protein
VQVGPPAVAVWPTSPPPAAPAPPPRRPPPTALAASRAGAGPCTKYPLTRSTTCTPSPLPRSVLGGRGKGKAYENRQKRPLVPTGGWGTGEALPPVGSGLPDRASEGRARGRVGAGSRPRVYHAPALTSPVPGKPARRSSGCSPPTRPSRPAGAAPARPRPATQASAGRPARGHAGSGRVPS